LSVPPSNFKLVSAHAIQAKPYPESVKLFERPAALALLCLGICAAFGLLFWFTRQSIAPTPTEQARYFPDANGSTLSIDVAAMRRAGFLEALTKMAVDEEADYKQFVAETRFDYTRDLDHVLGVLAPKRTQFLLSGRFDWAALERYARANQGACAAQRCWVPASRPGEFISYALPRPGLLAIQVSPNRDGVRELDALHQSPAFEPEEGLVAVKLRRNEVDSYAAAPTKIAPLLRALGPVESLGVRLGQQLIATILFPSAKEAESIEGPLREIARQLESGETSRQDRTITLTWKLDMARLMEAIAK
jgi:hypothetical protein